MRIKAFRLVAFGIFVTAMLSFSSVQADEFTQEDIDLWESEYQAVVKKGRQVFTDPTLGTNGVVCAQCHPNATNTHPETYPKFQKQIGRVITMGEMINFCIRNPLEGKDLALDDPRMVAMLAYITEERRDVKLAPGKH
jgi:cytochrome c